MPRERRKGYVFNPLKFLLLSQKGFLRAASADTVNLTGTAAAEVMDGEGNYGTTEYLHELALKNTLTPPANRTITIDISIHSISVLILFVAPESRLLRL